MPWRNFADRSRSVRSRSLHKLLRHAGHVGFLFFKESKIVLSARRTVFRAKRPSRKYSTEQKSFQITPFDHAKACLGSLLRRLPQTCLTKPKIGIMKTKLLAGMASVLAFVTSACFYETPVHHHVETTPTTSTVVTTLPNGYKTVTYRGTDYYTYNNTYYRPHGSGYMVVANPY